MTGPLDGYRIIDLTAVVLGPIATLHLADMGADVIKVEPPEGDIMRNPGNAPTPGMGPVYMSINRNKRALCLDLKKPEAIAALKRLIAGADVFVHNMRVEAIERLGLGYEAVKAVKPDIVYAYSVGYKHSGPYGQKPAFDDLVQGASGAAMLASRVDGGPPRFLPSLIVDKTTGLHLGMAILAALLHRERTGEGQKVEVPMLEVATGFWLVEHLFEYTYVPPRGTMGYKRVLSADRRPYRTMDGYICALPYNEKHYRAFADEIGRPELMSDPRFASMQARSNNQQAIQAIISEVMPTRTTVEWLAFFDKADIPAMPVQDLEHVLEDPHLSATGFFTTREHPTEGPIRTMASPFDFSATPTAYRRHAPLLGADGREVLAEAGFSADDIAGLEASGALRGPPERGRR
ncbi:MAG: CoA transferase [Hyphomicrobiaceae bacterium]|nr:CoA transferase [Hyphomicrobiaceae bacterium]